MLALEKQVWQEKRTALSIQQNSGLRFRKFLVPILVAQTRPKPPRVWLLFLWAGYKTAVLGTIILSNGKGHSGPTDRNDQTGQSGQRSKLVPNIPVEPNRNGPFHLMYQPKFPEFWVEWKAPKKIDLYRRSGLRWPQRVGISWEPLCLLLDRQGDRRRLCLQGDPNTDQKFISPFIITT